MDDKKLLDDMIELFNSKDKISISKDINPLLFKYTQWEPLDDRLLQMMSYSVNETLDIMYFQGVYFKCLPIYSDGGDGVVYASDFVYEKICSKKSSIRIDVESDFI